MVYTLAKVTPLLIAGQPLTQHTCNLQQHGALNTSDVQPHQASLWQQQVDRQPQGQGNRFHIIGLLNERHTNHDDGQQHQPDDTILGPPLYRALLPVPFSGSSCYMDVATALDSTLQVPREAGLRVFIINNQSHPPVTIYIKGKLRGSTSVLMAEAAALALAARVVFTVGIQSLFFLTNN